MRRAKALRTPESRARPEILEGTFGRVQIPEWLLRGNPTKGEKRNYSITSPPSLIKGSSPAGPCQPCRRTPSLVVPPWAACMATVHLGISRPAGEAHGKENSVILPWAPKHRRASGNHVNTGTRNTHKHTRTHDTQTRGSTQICTSHACMWSDTYTQKHMHVSAPQGTCQACSHTLSHATRANGPGGAVEQMRGPH